MKFNINNDEILALSAMIKTDCENVRTLMHGKTNSPINLLILSILEEMFIKLLQKSLLRKEKYSIKWAPYQAIAFWMRYNGLLPETTHIGNTVQKLCNAIHQEIIFKL